MALSVDDCESANLLMLMLTTQRGLAHRIAAELQAEPESG
jgi:hypothetical protein